MDDDDECEMVTKDSDEDDEVKRMMIAAVTKLLPISNQLLFETEKTENESLIPYFRFY